MSCLWCARVFRCHYLACIFAQAFPAMAMSELAPSGGTTQPFCAVFLFLSNIGMQVLRRYLVQNRDDYVKYNRIVGLITKLTARLQVCVHLSLPLRLRSGAQRPGCRAAHPLQGTCVAFVSLACTLRSRCPHHSSELRQGRCAREPPQVYTQFSHVDVLHSRRAHRRSSKLSRDRRWIQATSSESR